MRLLRGWAFWGGLAGAALVAIAALTGACLLAPGPVSPTPIPPTPSAPPTIVDVSPVALVASVTPAALSTPTPTVTSTPAVVTTASPTARATQVAVPANMLERVAAMAREAALAAMEALIPEWSGARRLNFVLIGADRRPGEEFSRSDTIMIFSVDPKTRSAALISVPRDLCVGECKTARDRINGVFLNKGADGLASALGELLDLDIQHHVVIDFQGFEKVVDALGGVEVEVYEAFDERFIQPGSGAEVRLKLEPGKRLLDGKTALMYARSRLANPRSDWDRICRQQQVMVALRDRAISGRALSSAPALLSALGGLVETDFPLTEAPPLLKLVFGIPPERTVLRVVDHQSGTILGHEGEDGAEMLKPDPEKLRGFVREVLQQAASGTAGRGRGDAILFNEAGCG